MTDVHSSSSSDFLRALDRTERYVLALFYADDLSTGEIGVVLDIPEHRVMTILERLRDRARHVLGLRTAVA